MNLEERMNSLEQEAHGKFVRLGDVMPDEKYVRWFADEARLGSCIHFGCERSQLSPDELVFVFNR